MKPNVLIVEDDEHQRLDIERKLNTLPEEEKRIRGIDGFVVDQAGTTYEAKLKIESAVNQKIPYDILFLDLGFPSANGSGVEDPDEGIKLLEIVRKAKVAISVVVVSHFGYHPFIVNAFRGGACDFIAKPYEAIELQQRALAAWDYVIGQRRGCLLEHRLIELMPYAHRGISDELGILFSDFTQSVFDCLDGLEVSICERQGLDLEKDIEDPLVRNLLNVKQAMRKGADLWKRHQSSIIANEAIPCCLILEDKVRQILDKIQPCLISEGVEFSPLEDTRTPVLGFDQDTVIVLKEIMLGPLVQAATPDPENRKKTLGLKIGRGDREDMICATFSNNFATISAEDTACISKAEGFASGLGNAWGLSVAQHIAVRGGGSLKVASNGPDKGYEVEYNIRISSESR